MNLSRFKTLVVKAVLVALILIAAFVSEATTEPHKLIIVKQPKVHKMRIVTGHKLDTLIANIANRYNLDYKTFKAILIVESNLNTMAINIDTFDLGIGQVSQYNIAAKGLNRYKLLYDTEYSLIASAEVLSYFSRRFSTKETLYFCRYNVGTGKLVGKRLQNCLTYATKVLEVRSKLD